MILELTPNTHPILHNKVKPCSVNLDRHFVAKTLIENMHHYEGIGLAANQIGMDVRAFAMIRDLENNEVVVCFNPKIVKKYSMLYTITLNHIASAPCSRSQPLTQSN